MDTDIFRIQQAKQTITADLIIGTTSNVHLHLSFNSILPDYGNAFLNSARLFDPSLYPAILTGLRSANIELLHDWADSAYLE